MKNESEFAGHLLSSDDAEAIAAPEQHSGFFPSIEQFRHVVRAERDVAAFHNRPPAKRSYIGTVKLHGTNAGISLTADGGLIYRSRSRELSPADDNHGFARHMSQHEDAVRDMLAPFAGADMVTVFGEWCGASVQAGVAICAEQKMFVMFALRIGHDWRDVSEVGRRAEARIFNIRDYPTWIREIDFAQPEQSQNELVALTEAVEAECPVGKAFGHTGVGEGIVWTPLDGDTRSKFWFKVKGEKHSATKVRTLAAVDVERFRQRDELVAAVVTTNRMQQGLDLHVNEFGRPLEMSAIGDYLRWVFNDVAKEEADTISASDFELKELGKGISDVAKRFYIDAVNAKL